MKAAISALSCWTLRWTPRLICLSASSANQRSTWFKPGGAGRREVQVIARVVGEPSFDGRRLVGGVIVEHQMDVEIGRHGLLDLREEVAEFDRAVTLVTAADDPAGDNVQGGEQRGRAVPCVIVAAPLGLPR